MTKHLTAYVNEVLPGHSVRSVHRSAQYLGPTTVVAHFADVDAASRAAVAVIDEPGDVDVVAILRPPRDPVFGSGAPITSESALQVSARRVGTWGMLGGLVGALVVVIVCIVVDAAATVGVLTSIYGFGLGFVVGGTIGGLGRFGGEHAWSTTSLRATDAVGGAVAVHATDDSTAEAVARRMSECEGAMDVRVVDEHGFWHAPYSDN